MGIGSGQCSGVLVLRKEINIKQSITHNARRSFAVAHSATSDGATGVRDNDMSRVISWDIQLD